MGVDVTEPHSDFYHIVFVQKCRTEGVEIIEAECCSDHIHMLVRIPPKYSASEVVGYLKVKSLLLIFEKHANLKC